MPLKDPIARKEYWSRRGKTEEHKAINKAWRKTEAGRRSLMNSQMKNLYGITVEDFYAMFAAQNGKCAICGIHQTQMNKRIGVDHDHKTGKVRDLLCHECNQGIGKLKDNPVILRAAADYLERHAKALFLCRQPGGSESDAPIRPEERKAA